jgi:phosphate starvation-inducible PhoH-like protein
MSEKRVDTDAVRVSLEDIDPLELLGDRDRNLRAIERHFGVTSGVRNGELTLRGAPDAVSAAKALLSLLIDRVRAGRLVSLSDVEDFLSGRIATENDRPAPDRVLRFDRKQIRPRSPQQSSYLEAIDANDIVFGIGPAGTGKTYLAVGAAVQALRSKEIDRLVLVRPAVEAGERLGYLPGDLQEKVDPYLRPLYDALSDMMSNEKLQRLIQSGVIEIVPLAYMRGRTLARAFVILDEAQNTTLRQMKMVLTRLGMGSRAVVTGDVTQIDLPNPEESGLVRIQPILERVDGVSFVYFSDADVVRHRLVRDILEAFDRSNVPDGTR